MSSFILVLLVALTFSASSGFANPVAVSVTKFKDKTGPSNCRYNWDWWHAYLGDGFQDMLITELNKSSKLEVLERETIRDIFDNEQNLVNSEKEDTLERGKFKKARYTFVGAVTEFEYCAQKKNTHVNIGAVAGLFGVTTPELNVGFSGAKAKVTVDLRVIDTKSGRVVKSVQASEMVEDSRFALDSEYGGHEQEQNSPADRAARLAIEKAAREVLHSI